MPLSDDKVLFMASKCVIMQLREAAVLSRSNAMATDNVGWNRLSGWLTWNALVIVDLLPHIRRSGVRWIRTKYIVTFGKFTYIFVSK